MTSPAVAGGMSACIIDHVRELPLQNPGWLFDIGDYATQLYGDYTKPMSGFLYTNQYNPYKNIYTVFMA